MADQKNFLEKIPTPVYYGIGIYFGYRWVVKPLLQNLGLVKSDEEKMVDSNVTDPGSPFSPNMWKSGPTGTLIIKEETVNKFIDTIWNSVGWFSDDFDAVLSVLKNLKTQSQVSYLADKFQQKKQKDLLNWLLGGNLASWPADRFSADQVAQLIDYAKKLPKYKY